MNFKPYYMWQYKNHNIGFDAETLSKVTGNLIGFFNKANDIDHEFFNEKEIAHLVDVQAIVFRLKIISVLLLACASYFIRQRGWEFVQRFQLAATLTVIAIFAFLFFVTGFDFLFTRFHELFFTGNYSFDPRISNLKAMYPDSFFLETAILILGLWLVGSIIWYILSCLRKSRNFQDN